MAVYTLDTICRDVRICLDQNAQGGVLTSLGDVDTLSLDELIRSKVVDAVTRVHSSAPAHLLDGGNNFGDALYWEDGKTCGLVLLPEDFMRLVVFEMNDWERAVYEVKSVYDADYALQRSRYKGIRGTPQRPICVMGIRPEGRVLEFYSCKSREARVRKAVYMPYPVLDNRGGIVVCSRCYRSVVYMIAGLVVMAYGSGEQAQVFVELSKTALV